MTRLSKMPDDYTEVLVAIGRIEEGVRYLREDMAGLKNDFQVQKQEVEAVKHDIRNIELDVHELKTQRNSNKSNIALIFAVLSAVATLVNLLW